MISAKPYMSMVLAQSAPPCSLHSMASTICRRRSGPLKRVACAMMYSTAVNRNVGRLPTKHAFTRLGFSGFFALSAAQSRSNAFANNSDSISGNRHRSSGSNRRTWPREISGNTCQNVSCSRGFGVCHRRGRESLSEMTPRAAAGSGFFTAAVSPTFTETSTTATASETVEDSSRVRGGADIAVCRVSAVRDSHWRGRACQAGLRLIETKIKHDESIL